MQDYDELEAERFLSSKKPKKAPAKNKPFGIEKPKSYPATTGSDVEAEGAGNCHQNRCNHRTVKTAFNLGLPLPFTQKSQRQQIGQTLPPVLQQRRRSPSPVREPRELRPS